MKKLLPFFIVLVVAGCASFTNPVTITRLAQIESGYGIALAGATTYYRACNQRKLDRKTCTPIVKQLRIYDQNGEAALAAARTAVGSGDSINAFTALTKAQNALSAFENVKARYGVQ